MSTEQEITSKVQFVEVEENGDGQRIDNYLMNRLKGVPKSWVYRVLRKGEVRVNKGRVKPPHRLKLGDTVRIPPVRTAQRDTSIPGSRDQEKINNSIIYEDNLMLIINKPSGYAVHGGSGVSHGIIEILRSLRPEAKYLELVHRLDRDTSGCLMVAKKRSALQEFQKLQLSGRIEKKYLALLDGKWRKGKVTVDAPLKKNNLSSGERVVRVDAEGKHAITHFEVKQRFGMYTLVEARLETGRTHQIRVHAAHVNTPIVGDPKYGVEETNKQFKKAGMNRLFLHAASLKFPWPDKKGGYKFEAPLSSTLAEAIENLK